MSLILDWLFPKTCLRCGRPGRYFCPRCLSQQIVLSPRIFNDSVHEANLSLFKYNRLIKKGITELKYNFVSDLADELAKICSNLIKNNYPNVLNYWQSHQFTLIPVPLHFFRQNWRGFNQSEILGQKIANDLSLSFNSKILRRHSNTPSQVKLKKKSMRAFNPSNAFTTNIYEKLNNIIIFDDVLTTGSTLKFAQDGLKNVDLVHCWYLTVAH